uniref:Uncharacterized protein n=1 Tax=Arundo donax TaxID=35708 RepID=A0A0A8YXY9_ARUDO
MESGGMSGRTTLDVAGTATRIEASK